ncbi:MAG: YgiT-type zinc finger protein [Anaerolineales bacterium]|nr:YgiT-type zinc finger protein [Anaerolineales bacterium]
MDPAADFDYEIPCELCQTGHLQPRLAALAAWVAGEFITVPQFPVWLCDVCGARQYDAEALEQLKMVLGPQAALRRGQRPAAVGRGRSPAGWRATGRYHV